MDWCLSSALLSSSRSAYVWTAAPSLTGHCNAGVADTQSPPFIHHSPPMLDQRAGVQEAESTAPIAKLATRMFSAGFVTRHRPPPPRPILTTQDSPTCGWCCATWCQWAVASPPQHPRVSAPSSLHYHEADSRRSVIAPHLMRDSPASAIHSPTVTAANYVSRCFSGC